MNEALAQEFLTVSRDQLKLLASRIEDCLGRLSEEQIWLRHHETENAIGNLVLHLCGNVQQWIIANLGGEPDNRQRDSEFAQRGGIPAPELRVRLRDTIAHAVEVIDRLSQEQLLARRRIQGYEVTGLAAVYHVVEHFAQHTGQILFATKLFTGADLGYYRQLSAPAR